MTDADPSAMGTLTDREREIARLVGRGWSYPQIAASLPNLRSRDREGVSPRTVLVHVQSIARKIPASVEGSTPYRRVQRWFLELHAV